MRRRRPGREYLELGVADAPAAGRALSQPAIREPQDELLLAVVEPETLRRVLEHESHRLRVELGRERVWRIFSDEKGFLALVGDPPRLVPCGCEECLAATPQHRAFAARKARGDAFGD